jgi:Flp pilus assembly protein TadB
MFALRIAIATALIGAAVVFAVGVGIERSQGDHHTESPTTSEIGKLPEGSKDREALEAQRAAAGKEASEASHSETLFGVNTEADWVIAVTVGVSLILAAGVLVSPTIVVFAVVGLVALAAGAFDIREAMHQANESRQTVLALAIAAATLHFGVAAIAFVAARTSAGQRNVIARPDPSLRSG